MLKRIVSALALATFAYAAQSSEAPDEVRQRVLAETRVVVVTEFNEPAAQYKSDGDPTTLELIFLKDPKDAPSRVSDDGEVIFLYEASEKQQQELFEKAFEIRIARELSGT